MDECDTITAFVRVLAHRTGNPTLVVDRWPDKEPRTGPITEPEIDAVAGKFAIEHTSIDSVTDQRERNASFLDVVRGLDSLIKEHVGCGFTVTLEFDAIGKGMDWKRIRDDLKKWIRERAPLLKDGNHEVILPTSESAAFPIVMSIWKGPAPRAGFSRFAPEDDTLPARIRSILDRKAKKLGKYQGPSTTTILLVENDDIALMNEVKMLEAIQEAYPDGPPQGVDEIWFADTSVPDSPQFRDFTTRIGEESHQPWP